MTWDIPIGGGGEHGVRFRADDGATSVIIITYHGIEFLVLASPKCSISQDQSDVNIMTVWKTSRSLRNLSDPNPEKRPTENAPDSGDLQRGKLICRTTR